MFSSLVVKLGRPHMPTRLKSHWGPRPRLISLFSFQSSHHRAWDAVEIQQISVKQWKKWMESEWMTNKQGHLQREGWECWGWGSRSQEGSCRVWEWVPGASAGPMRQCLGLPPLSSSFSYPQQPVMGGTASSPFRSWLAGWGREAGLRGTWRTRWWGPQWGACSEGCLLWTLLGWGGGQGQTGHTPPSRPPPTPAPHSLMSPSSHL